MPTDSCNKPGRPIAWVPFDRGDIPADPVVWVDVAKVDAAWRRSPDDYVRPGGFLQDNSPYRYGRAKERFRTGEPTWMPWLLLQNGELSLEDGRHRFACARDHGVTALPVHALSDPIEIERLYGTSETSNYPHLDTALASVAPSSISVSRDSPRQITVFPGGGSLRRAR